MLEKPSQHKVTLSREERRVKRLELCISQNWRCVVCGNRMTQEPGLMHTATLGHRKCQPRGCAKDDSDENLIGAICWRCNFVQGSKPA